MRSTIFLCKTLLSGVISYSLLSLGAMAQSFPVGARYVAMGSSYAAGPGVGTPDSSSGGCARSKTNYAHLLASRRHLTLVDVTCSGATTEDILTRSQNGFAPQIEAVTSATRLVTMTIGGNDVDYVGNLMGRSCYDENMAKGQVAQAKKCGILPAAEVEKRLDQLPAKLLSVASEVRKRAPNATIVFVSYLPVLPISGICSDVPLTLSDAGQMRNTYYALTSRIRDAAQRTNSILIRTAVLGASHDACSAVPYTAGFHPPVSPGWSSAVPYHPTQAGMQAVAGAIDEALSK